MSNVAMALLVVGLIVNVIATLIIVVAAFRESVLWGLGSLFVPLVSIIFVITHWDETKMPFLWSVGGLVLVVLGVMMSPATESGLETASAPQSAPTPTATALAYTPQLDDFPSSPPPPSTRSATPPQKASMIPTTTPPVVEKVWADNRTKLYYLENCKSRPSHAYPIAKRLAVMQGFKEGQCAQ